MNEIKIEIRDSLSIDEYNNLRIQVGWEPKNPIIVEKAINFFRKDFLKNEDDNKQKHIIIRIY